MPSRNAGFTLIELVVGLVILVLIATTVTPVLLARLDRARVDAGVSSLEGLAAALVEFHADTDDYPRFLTQLAAPVDAAAQNSCQRALAEKAAAWRGPYVSRVLTAAGAPIGIGTAQNTLVRFPAQGIDAAAGTGGGGGGGDTQEPCWPPGHCKDAFGQPTRPSGEGGSSDPWGDGASGESTSTGTPGDPGVLSLVVTGVSEEDALAVNERVDGDASRETGSVRWSAPDAQGVVTLNFVIPIAGC